MFKILIVGYYGWNIIGDDCILQGILDIFKEKNFGANFTVTSETPIQTHDIYSVKTIDWKDVYKVCQTISESDLVILGGGGVFNEYDVWRNLESFTQYQDFNVFCSIIPILSNYFETPCTIFSIGVEPLLSDQAKTAVRTAFNLSQHASVRDSGSKSILKKIDLDRDIEVNSDPAFCLKTNLDNEKIEKSKLTIGVSIRNWKKNELQQDWEKEIANSLDSFAKKYDCQYLFLPFQQDSKYGELADDLTIMHKIKKLMQKKSNVKIIDTPYDFKKTVNYIQQCDMMLGMRYHSIVLSAKFSIPCVGLIYSLKVKSIVDQAGLENISINLKSFSHEQLFECMEECFKKSKKIKKNLSKFSSKMNKEASKPIKEIKSILSNKDQNIQPQIVNDVINLLVSKSFQQLNETSLSRILFTLARRWVSEQKYLEAEQLIESILKINSMVPELNYLYAFCIQNQKKDFAKALKHYTISLDSGFDEFWVRYNRGLLYTKLDNLDNAYSDLKKAVSLNPNHSGARKSLESLESVMTEKRKKM